LNTFKINCDHKKIFISPNKIIIKDKTNRITKIKLFYKKSGLQYQAQEMMENLNNGTLKMLKMQFFFAPDKYF
jgi:hypothetical protein